MELSGLVRSGYGAGLERLSDIRLARSYSALRLSLDRLLTAGFLGRLFLECLPEKAPDQDLYDLLIDLYDSLCAGTDVRTTALVAQDRLLLVLGFQIDLEACVLCQAVHVRGFSAVHGGVVCEKCLGGSRATSLSTEAVKALLEIRKLRLGKEMISLPPGVTREVGRVFKLQLREHLGVSESVFRPVLPARSVLRKKEEEQSP